MASVTPSTNPLDALQLLLNDALVQTAKALRASRRDDQGNLVQAQGVLQSKLPDTVNAFHSALDDLDHNIIQAKSVLLRDLNQLRAKSQVQPVEAQTKEPISIDLDSSPPASGATANANGDSSAQPDGAADINLDSLAGTNDTTQDMSIEQSFADVMGDSGFGDMNFSATAAADGDAATQSFDFGNGDAAADLLSLESIGPAPTTDASAADAVPATTAAADDAQFAELFGNDEGQADGMDFDFSIGGSGGGGTGGMGGDDTFDDLMNTRDGDFGMGGDDFDASFLELDGK